MWGKKRSGQDLLEQLLRQRTILLGTALDDNVANVIIAQLLFLRSESAERISLHIDSPGGNIAAAVAIRDAIDEMRDLVTTHCLAQAAGAALLLLAHGARGSRTAAPTARMMMTPIESSADADPQVARTRALVDRMLAEDTGQSTETIARDAAAMRSFAGQDACDYGLIDRIA